MNNMKFLRPLIATLLFASLVQPAFSAIGHMGTGTPEFGIYGSPHGNIVNVWSLTNQTQAFPAGCTALTVRSATLGMDSYKIIVATLLAAKVSGKRIFFYAHAERDSGCGVDYVQIIN